MTDDCSRCREELARLTEENAALRRAALAFGSLAERLNLALQEERRLPQRAASARETMESRMANRDSESSKLGRFKTTSSNA